MPKKFKGFLDCNPDPIIVINSRLNYAERRCVYFEELIHYQYFKNCDFYKCKTYYELCHCNWKENKVKRRLAVLLISSNLLKNKVMPYLDTYPLSVIAEDINVTEELLKLRLEIYNG